ncbi:MAG TPA: DUF4105 domain-containing protein, partial [Gemmatimonadaceae bacterium]
MTRRLAPRVRRVAAALLTLVAALLAAPRAHAQAGRAAAAPVGEPGSELTIYLVTMGPGDAIWEKFGHNALWVHDAATGSDVAYNWGMFDFAEKDFIPRFLKGSMRYWMAGYQAQPMIDAYARTNRSVWVQELTLTPAQRRELRDFVVWNSQPDNAYYNYNYFLDNCSTRVRDVIDRVLGGRLRARFDTAATGTTFRWHMRRLTQEEQPLYTGMNLVLGEPGDRPISAWEEMFLPMKLRDRVRELSVPGPDGAPRPLVAAEREVFTAQRAPEPTAPANLIPGYLLLGAVLGGAMALLARAAAAGSRAAARGLATLGTLWSLLAGLVGLVMVLTWTATDHTFMYRNENLLQLSPLSLLLVAVLPRYVLRGRAADAARYTSLAVGALALLGWALQLLPGLDQVNGEIIAL